METLKEKINQTATFIKSKSSHTPRVGVVLGSGLGAFVDKIEQKIIIPYSEIPYFKKVTVKGHGGKLILGKINGVEVAVMQGRFHFYEGHGLDEVVFPVRVLKKLGIETLILTNAAGGVNLGYKPGELVVLTDHINLTGQNPLIGPNDEEFGPRFPDMTHTYDSELIKLLDKSAGELNISIQKGIYAGVLGPTYETPSEIKMIRILGGDVVGMSTVPEAIVANHLGLKICGVSCVTNMGAGITNQKLNHDDIKDEALKVMNNFTELLNLFISKLKDQKHGN